MTTPPTTKRRRGPERTTGELTEELDVLKQVNAELLDVLNSLSLKYWVDRLQEAEKRIDRLATSNVLLEAKVAKLDESLEKARRAFATMQAKGPAKV